MSVLVRDVTCRQAVELVTDYLEGQLSRRDRRGLERHLAACRDCSAYLAQVQAVLDATGRAGPEDLDDATIDGLVELFRKARGTEP
jgi:anti-sigma factor RsiW